MLVEACEVSFASNEQNLCTPKDAVEVDNLNEISLEDANVTYFDNGYIGCSICRRRKRTDCKVLLLADNERQEQNKEYISEDYMSLFDYTNRRLSAITELRYAVTTLAVQACNAVLSDREIRIKFLAFDKRRCVFTQALFSSGSRKFWWGDFKHKTSKIRISSPKLRVIFRPKSEIQTFFPPKNRWSPKKKNHPPLNPPLALLRLSSSSAAVLKKRCSQNHENLALIFQTAFNCFAKNELKSLCCRKSKPPAKMQRTTRKLYNKSSCKHSDV